MCNVKQSVSAIGEKRLLDLIQIHFKLMWREGSGMKRTSRQRKDDQRWKV